MVSRAGRPRRIAPVPTEPAMSRDFRLFRARVRAALVLVVVVAAVAATAPAAGRTSARDKAAAKDKAATATRFAVPGLKQPVEIVVDRYGIPHIYAKSEDDVFVAQGFNAARDRLFQIDLWRRRGLGELASVFGPSFVDQDRATRLFLYRGDMDREWRIYSSKGTKEAERIAQRFVAGINAYVDLVALHPEKLPWEFATLGYAPAKWRAEDVVRIRSHGLTRNLVSEVARAGVACKTGSLAADALRFGLEPPWEPQMPEGLDPCLPPDVLKVFTLATQNVQIRPVAAKPVADSGATRVAEAGATPAFEAAPLAALPTVDEAEGSNNWVVAPSKSATGRAIMANDPHRAYSVPSLRYLAHLSAPGLDVIGAGEPALPGISIGHNGTIAFGLTIFNIDQEDLYVYELNPANPDEYRYKEGFEPFRKVTESIAVKGGAPVAAELVFTRHGPVIHVDREKGRAYAVRSGWLEPGMAPYFGSVDYMKVKNFAQFRQAMQNWGAPTENLVYADVKGNIGWAPGGLAPRRPNWDGLLPVPGDGRYEWAGFWRGRDLPYAYNPPEGFIATANHMNLPPDYPYKERKLGFEWTNPSRYLRVAEVLAALPKVSLADSMRLQNDITSIPARRLKAVLAPLGSPEPKTQRALDMLRNWDAVERADSAAAALFEVWMSRHLNRAFLDAALGKPTSDAVPVADVAVLLDAVDRPVPRFGADYAVAQQKRNEMLLASLGSAFAEMEKLQGGDPASWQWGRLHYNQLDHPLAAIVDGSTRAKVSVGPLPKAGGPYTPSQSTYRASDYRHTNGPSFRVVVDVGRFDASRAINHPGQSGDPASRHYRDQAASWLAGDYVPLLYSRKAVADAAETRITLVPAAQPPRRRTP